MPPAPWRPPLELALDRNPDAAARFVQLATVRPGGRPANRTLVFRGFRAGSDQLRFATDVRSAKVAEIRHYARGEVCWYFAATREQFRLAGTLELIGADAPDAAKRRERAELWAALSDAARTQFTWPAPGDDRAPDGAFAGPAPDPRQPPASFGLLLLDPDAADHLELTVLPHRRTAYERGADRNWLCRFVNP
jgi:pyridoxamine 5'-phosphate oxidase